MKKSRPVEVQLHAFLTSKSDTGSGLQAPADLSTDSKSPVGGVGPTAGLDVGYEIIAPDGNETTTSWMSPATPSLNWGSASGPINYKIKVKVKVTLEQATKAQRGARGLALIFF